MRKILSNIIGGLNVPKIIKAVKGSDLQVKSIKGLAVTGTTLLTSGVTLITDGVILKSYHEIIGGVILILVWAFVSERMGEKISKIK
jgi:hypothetical protein